MAAWADFCITAANYGPDGAAIVEVDIRQDNGESIGAARRARRQEVVAAIDRGTTFVTAYKADDGQWRKGEAVRSVTISGQKYLRTDSNAVKADNLGRLPRCV